MIHFTCDLCGKDLSEKGVPRFVVKIAAYAGHDPNQIGADDLDDDHMEAVAELLQRGGGAEHADDEAAQFKGFRFDLCGECHHRFVQDPLGRDALRLLNFSKN